MSVEDEIKRMSFEFVEETKKKVKKRFKENGYLERVLVVLCMHQEKGLGEYTLQLKQSIFESMDMDNVRNHINTINMALIIGKNAAPVSLYYIETNNDIVDGKETALELIVNNLTHEEKLSRYDILPPSTVINENGEMVSVGEGEIVDF